MPDHKKSELILTPPVGSTLLAPGVSYDKLGLIISDEQIPYEVWYLAGQTLAEYQRESDLTFMWSWGDWIAFGSYAYGEKYSQALSVTGKALSTLTNYKWASSKIPRELRGLPGLAQRHYIEASKVKDPELKQKLLTKASEDGWTATALTRAIDKEIRPPLSPPLPPEEPSTLNVNVSDSDDPNRPPNFVPWPANDPRRDEAPPPATKEDVIDDLQFQQYTLEKQNVDLFAKHSWLEAQVAKALEELHEGSVEEAVTTLEKPQPDQTTFNLIVTVITHYEAGDTTSMIDALDVLVDMVKNRA